MILRSPLTRLTALLPGAVIVEGFWEEEDDGAAAASNPWAAVRTDRITSGIAGSHGVTA